MGYIEVSEEEFFDAHKNHMPDNMSAGEVSRIADAAGVPVPGPAKVLMEVRFRNTFHSIRKNDKAYDDTPWDPDNICYLRIQRKLDQKNILEVLKCQDDWFFVRLFYAEYRRNPANWAPIQGACWKCDQLGPVLDLIRKARDRTDNRYRVTGAP
jgi:hypothetical protein